MLKKTIKNIIIIGPPRCGKTTLAKRIVKELYGFSLISEDNFRSSYISTCKELGIDSINMTIPSKLCFNYLYQSMYYEDDLNYVVDISYYDDYNDETIKQYKDSSIILFMGYSDLSKNELFNNIRKYDKPNEWTYVESDERLYWFCEHFIDKSKQLEKIAKSYNYWYVDVSNDRENILLNTFEKIKEILNEDKR